MNKYKIYIDFEAIDRSLVRILKLNIDFLPFCYTVGTYNSENKFITTTSILDFKKITIHNVYYLLAENLKKDIKKITNKPNLVIKNNTVRFIGWNPFLENKITNKIFKMNTFPQVKYEGVSLDTISRKGNFSNNYFSSIYNIQTKNKLHIRTIKFNKHGYTASYVGFLLLKYFKKMKFFKLDMNDTLVNALICEMKIYNNDDVVKMHYVNSNFIEISKKINKIKMLRKKFQQNNNNLRSYSLFYLYLKEIYKSGNITIDNVQQDLQEFLKKIKNTQYPLCVDIDLKFNLETGQLCKLLELIEKTKQKYKNLQQLFSYLLQKIEKLKKTINEDKEKLEITLFKE